MDSCFEPAPKDGSPWLPLIRGDLVLFLMSLLSSTGGSSLLLSSFLASNFWNALFARSLLKLFREFYLPPTLSAMLFILFLGLYMKLLTVVTGLLLFREIAGEVACLSSSFRWWTPDNLLLYSFAHWLNRSSARPAMSPSEGIELSLFCFRFWPPPSMTPPGFCPEIREPMFPSGSNWGLTLWKSLFLICPIIGEILLGSPSLLDSVFFKNFISLFLVLSCLASCWA